MSILGPSGCGKTTLLRILIGLEQQTAGEILVNNKNIEMQPSDKRGQQQRAAIARTLVLNPSIVLLDEPMSALDVDNKEVMKKELKEVQKKFSTTMIYVTHDQEEAFYLSDRIMVMSNGKIEQLGTPSEIYHHPESDCVENFVGRHLEHKLEQLERYTGRGKNI